MGIDNLSATGATQVGPPQIEAAKRQGREPERWVGPKMIPSTSGATHSFALWAHHGLANC